MGENRRSAVVTGASSGIGMEIAKVLGEQGYSLYLTGRNREPLEALASAFPGRTEIHLFDLSKPDEVQTLGAEIQELHPEVMINNAGFGLFGDFDQADMKKTEQLIAVNCSALTHLLQAAIRGMEGQNKGYILNVASVAGLLPAGPHLATYYASKSYVVSLTLGIRQELLEKHSGISVSTLCPGPVDTQFNERAGVRFALPGMQADRVAGYAIQQMFRKKPIIIPGFTIRASAFLGRLLPRTLYTHMISGQQRKKG